MKFLSLKKIKNVFFLKLSNLPMPGHAWRPFFVRLGGIQVVDYKKTFFGENIGWDTVNPELIIVESGVRITAGCTILTHFIDPKTGDYRDGTVLLKKGAFVGTKSIITKPVTIGRYAVIGAGSVVTKDIPDGEVWAGNPARCIGKSKIWD